MSQPAIYDAISDPAVVGYMFQALDGAAARGWVPRLSNQFSSNQDTETYAGIGAAPMLREWVGEKLRKQANKYSLTITNKDWESTLEVNTKDLRRDKTGQLLMRISELAGRATEHDAKLLSTIINTGDANTNGTAYDGELFFDTDHAVGSSGTINNDITYNVATTTDPTATEASEAIMDTIQALYGFKDDQGEPTNQDARSFTIMVPTAFWAAFQTAISEKFLTNGVSNPLVGAGLNLTLVQNPRLTWTEAFAVFVDDSPRKALIVQLEDGPRVQVLGDGSDHEFHNASHLYSVIKTGNVGYGDFLKAALCTLT